MKLTECLTWDLVRLFIKIKIVLQPRYFKNMLTMSFLFHEEPQVRSIANHVRPDRQSK